MTANERLKARGLECMVICLWAAISFAETGPRCVLGETAVDFGRIAPSREASRVVLVTNTGDAALLITRVAPSCECTHAVVNPAEVFPGETAELTITVAPQDYPHEEVSSRVGVDTNEPASNHHEIAVTAVLEPEYAAQPDRLEFGTLKKGQTHQKTFIVRQSGEREVRVIGVEASPGITATFRELAQSPPHAYEVTVALDPATPAGTLNGSVTVMTDLRRMPRKSLPVTAQIVGIECQIEPRIVVFGPAAPGQVVGKVDLAGVYDLEILEVQCAIRDISISVNTIEPGKRYALAVSLRDNATPGNKAGKIRLRLKEGPLDEWRELAVYGLVAGQ